jgi:hypothetical protein
MFYYEAYPCSTRLLVRTSRIDAVAVPDTRTLTQSQIAEADLESLTLDNHDSWTHPRSFVVHSLFLIGRLPPTTGQWYLHNADSTTFTFVPTLANFC